MAGGRPYQRHLLLPVGLPGQRNVIILRHPVMVTAVPVLRRLCQGRSVHIHKIPVIVGSVVNGIVVLLAAPQGVVKSMRRCTAGQMVEAVPSKTLLRLRVLTIAITGSVAHGILGIPLVKQTAVRTKRSSTARRQVVIVWIYSPLHVVLLLVR